MESERAKRLRPVAPQVCALFALLSLLQLTACAAARVSAPELPAASRMEFTLVPVDQRLQTFPNGTFDPNRAIFPIVKQAPMHGIPDTLRNVRVLHDFVDSNQYFYQSYRAGHISEALYGRISAHIDSTALTAEWVDGITISVLVAENAAGERVVVVDRDNDGDFRGEPALRFLSDTLRLGEERVPVKTATTRVSFEYFEDRQVKRRTAPILLVYPEGAEPEALSWQIAEYPVGTWTVRGETFTVALGAEAVFRPGRYKFFYVDVAGDGRFDPDPEGLEAYSVAEPFNIGGIGWRIAKLAADGSQAELARVDSTVLPRTALREGNPAIDYVAQTLTGERVSLADLRGRYVLLNFAATWCPYSRAEAPFLQAAQAEYAGERFAILTLVEPDTHTSVRRYVEEHGLSWAHVVQSREEEIARKYRVLGFPTNYLVNPEGIIVARGQALRGDSLNATLRRHLGEFPRAGREQ